MGIELTDEIVQFLSANLGNGRNKQLLGKKKELFDKFRSDLKKENDWDDFYDNASYGDGERLKGFLNEHLRIRDTVQYYIEDFLDVDESLYDEADSPNEEDEDIENDQIEEDDETEPQEIIYFNPIDIIQEIIGYLSDLEKIKSRSINPPKISPFAKHTLSYLYRGLEKILSGKIEKYKKLIHNLICSVQSNNKYFRKYTYDELRQFFREEPDAAQFIIDNQECCFYCRDDYESKISIDVVKKVGDFLLELDFYAYHDLQSANQNSNLISPLISLSWTHALVELDTLIPEGLFPNGKLNRKSLSETLTKHPKQTITIFSRMDEIRRNADAFIRHSDTPWSKIGDNPSALLATKRVRPEKEVKKITSSEIPIHKSDSLPTADTPQVPGIT